MARGRVRGTDDGVGRWETDDDVEEYQMMMIRVVLVAFVGFVLKLASPMSANQTHILVLEDLWQALEPRLLMKF